MRIWLKKLREQKNITQSQLANHIGIKQNYYSEIENGKKQQTLSFVTAIKLAEAFNISLDDLKHYELLETEVKE